MRSGYLASSPSSRPWRLPLGPGKSSVRGPIMVDFGVSVWYQQSSLGLCNAFVGEFRYATH